MAGLTSRLRRITASHIDAYLATVEDPRTLLPQLVREMKSRAAEALEAERKAAAAVRAEQRRLDESAGRSARLARGAELALRRGDEALAREALAEQVRTDRLAEDQRRALEGGLAALAEIRRARSDLQARLEDLRRRADSLAARDRSNRGAAGARRSAEKIREAGSKILEEASRLGRIEDAREAAAPPAGPPPAAGPLPAAGLPLEDRLRSLELETEIDRRLDRIRERKQT